MVYFSNGQITIRNMECGDAQAITDAEIEQDGMQPLKNIKKDWKINNQGRQFHWLQNIMENQLAI